MTVSATAPVPPSSSLWAAFLPLLPLMLVVFAGFLVVGMALPVVPLHVSHALGQGTVTVGAVMGSQYAASIIGRLVAGSMADARGPRRATLTGWFALCGVGLMYLASLAVIDRPALSLALLVVGRLLTGLTEAFVITATLAWGVLRVGPAHAGKVFGWMGVALFGAYGAGAPVGAWVHAHFGFAGLAWATVLVPLLVAAATLAVHAEAPTHAKRLPFYKVLGAVKLPGLGLTCSSAGFAMINAFVALLFVQRGWGGAALAFTSLGSGFVLARLVAGHLPDKLGGARVAMACVLIESVGQLLLWTAPTALLACAGAALTGIGYSLAFQSFGVEAVKRAPPQSRGAAMGGYVVFQDLSMGLAAPLGGWLALHAGISAVYLAGAAAALCAAAIAATLARG